MRISQAKRAACGIGQIPEASAAAVVLDAFGDVLGGDNLRAAYVNRRTGAGT